MNKPNIKIKPMNLIRRITQIASFLLLPGVFTSIFYAMKEIYIAVLEGSFTFAGMSSQILLLIAAIPVTMFMGRFFCGFFCSFGAMGDLIWFISRKTMKPKVKLGEKSDATLKLLKYGILLFLIVGVWSLNVVTYDSLSSPWTIFGMYASIGNWSSFQYLLTIGGFLLLLIMIGSFFIERFFCKYLCPLGALFALVSRLRLFNLKKNRANCGSCRLCTNKCTMGIPLYKYDKITSGECINCFACIENCPRNNVKANPTPAIASAVSVAAISSLLYVGNIASAATSDNGSSSNISTSLNTSTGKYADGTYTGSAMGFRGNTEVSVTVENGNISDITILSYQDDREYFERAVNSITSDIIESQDTSVSTVSGATFSSNGIIDAVANALSNADTTDLNSNTSDYVENSITNSTDTVDSTVSPSSDAASTDSSDGSSNDAASAGSTADSSSDTQTAENIDNSSDTVSNSEESTDSTSNTESTSNTNSTSSANNNSGTSSTSSTGSSSSTDNTSSADSTSSTSSSTSNEQGYQDGTYTGTGTGFRGETQVSVTVSNGIISDIAVVSYMDDERFFIQAQDTVINEIIDNQDVNVDAVSGATFSSNGIMEAVANAIGVSYTNTNATSGGGHGGFRNH